MCVGAASLTVGMEEGFGGVGLSDFVKESVGWLQVGEGAEVQIGAA